MSHFASAALSAAGRLARPAGFGIAGRHSTPALTGLAGGRPNGPDTLFGARAGGTIRRRLTG